MAPTLLRLEDYVSPGEIYYVGRRTELAPFRGKLHTHDGFAELTWIEYGVLLHVVNGDQRVLEAGDVVFIRPDDVHQFRPIPGRPFAQVSVSFPGDTLDFLKARYFGRADWAWSTHRLPVTHRLDHVRLERLVELAAVLVAGPADRLQLERFLLELLCDLIVRPGENDLPSWLAAALVRFGADPDALSEGVPALAELAGRSREHVNRVLQARTGRTATATINQLRLNRAAALLRMTDRPIATVAVDCGFSNLSHFYRLFNARFKVAPRRYRMVSTVSGYLPDGSGRTKQSRR